MDKVKASVIILLISYVFSGCAGPETKAPLVSSGQEDGTVRLYSQNPRYLEYQGKPLVLITSAEHYGAVLNLDFDYNTYLQTLSEEGFNYTRIFTGTYVEHDNNIFGIQQNTLGPRPDRYIAPWLKMEGKYDLEQFNPVYFDRLIDFIGQAEKLGIVVELTLFSSIYAENSWRLMPFFPDNNVNQTGIMDYRLVNTLYNGSLKNYQEKFIRKVVREVNGFGNLFFEIQNEPWADNSNLAAFVNEKDDRIFARSWQKRVEVANEVSMEWQEWVATVITDEEDGLAEKHLIAQNICNFQYDQGDLPEGISLINFHYALPDAVHMNLDLGGVIGLDETGFMPKEDQLYINQAWRFMLSGGGLYNNLDYSFTAASEDGSWSIADSNPGWGGPEFRKKLSHLVKAMEEVPFSEMEPGGEVFRSDASGLKQYALAKEGEVYLVFVENFKTAELIPEIPDGSYQLTWIHTDSGERKSEQVELYATVSLNSPFPAEQIVLKIEKSK